MLGRRRLEPGYYTYILLLFSIIQVKAANRKAQLDNAYLLQMFLADSRDLVSTLATLVQIALLSGCRTSLHTKSQTDTCFSTLLVCIVKLACNSNC